MTREEFIEKAVIKHGNKYDYSLVEYKNNSTKIKIVCPNHGVFEQTPNSHLAGSGCPSCVPNKKLTKEEFIKRSRKIHGDKYDYSLVEYKNVSSNIKIICPVHGVFEQKPCKHLAGHGCFSCYNERPKKLLYTTESFIEKLKEIHKNKYDYSITEYKGITKPIKYICPEHGIITQNAQSHFLGKGCKECAAKIIAEKHKLTTEDFIEKSRKVHGNKYDYSLSEYKDCNKKIKIICKKHGMFEQTARDHYRGNGCPACNESHGNRAVKLFLEENKIDYIPEWSNDTCRLKDKLRFDFYLPKLNTVIEFQGKQHFQVVEYWGGEEDFNLRKKRDEIKRKWCLENNIKEIEIHNIKDIQKILKKELKSFIIFK